MKLITRDTDYAIRALISMAGKKGSIVAVPELVEELEISRPFLRKIMQRLGKEKIIESRKGIGGGFLLKKDAGKVFITDIIRIFQGPVQLAECLLNKKACPNKAVCPLRSRIVNMERSIESEFGSVTIADLIKEARSMR